MSLGFDFEADIDRINAICGQQLYREAVQARISGPYSLYTVKLDQAISNGNCDAVFEWCYFAKQQLGDQFLIRNTFQNERSLRFERFKKIAEIGIDKGHIPTLALYIELLCDLIITKYIHYLDYDFYKNFISNGIKTVLDSDCSFSKGMLLIYLNSLHIRGTLKGIGTNDDIEKTLLKYTPDQTIAFIIGGNNDIRRCFVIEILILVVQNLRIINPYQNFHLIEAITEKRVPLNENFYKSQELAANYEIGERSFVAAQKAEEYGSININVYEVLQMFYFDLAKPHYNRMKAIHYLMLYFKASPNDEIHRSNNAFGKRINSLWVKVFRHLAKRNIRDPGYPNFNYHNCDSDLTGALNEICFYGSEIYSVTKWCGRFTGCPHDFRCVFEDLYLEVSNKVKKTIVILLGIWKFRRPAMKPMLKDVMGLISKEILKTKTYPLIWLTVEEIRLKQLIRSIKYFSEPKFQEPFDIVEIERSLTQTIKTLDKKPRI